VAQATNLKDGFLYAGSKGGAAGNDDISLANGVHVFGDVHSGPAKGSAWIERLRVRLDDPQCCPGASRSITVPVIPMGASYGVANGHDQEAQRGTYNSRTCRSASSASSSSPDRPRL
jgi:hypothetical protein